MLSNLWRAIFGPRTRQSRASYTPRPPEKLLDSPVPWISDEVWTCWSRPALASEPAAAAIVEPELVEVTDGDRARCPHQPVRRDATLPPTGSHSDHLDLLGSTPSPGGWVYCPAWPICCSRLSTLLFEQNCGIDILDLEASVGCLDDAYLEGVYCSGLDPSDPGARKAVNVAVGQDLDHLRRWGATDGVLVFQCRACGGVFLSACHP